MVHRTDSTLSRILLVFSEFVQVLNNLEKTHGLSRSSRSLSLVHDFLTSLSPSRKTVLVEKRFPARSNNFCRSSPNLSITRNRNWQSFTSCWPVAMKRGTPRDETLWDDIHSRTDIHTVQCLFMSRLHCYVEHDHQPRATYYQQLLLLMYTVFRNKLHVLFSSTTPRKIYNLHNTCR